MLYVKLLVTFAVTGELRFVSTVVETVLSLQDAKRRIKTNAKDKSAFMYPSFIELIPICVSSHKIHRVTTSEPPYRNVTSRVPARILWSRCTVI